MKKWNGVVERLCWSLGVRVASSIESTSTAATRCEGPLVRIPHGGGVQDKHGLVGGL